jgi:hypothetical protein
MFRSSSPSWLREKFVLVARTRVATEVRDKGRVMQLWQAEVTNSSQPERVSHGIVGSPIRECSAPRPSGRGARDIVPVAGRVFRGAPFLCPDSPDGGREERTVSKPTNNPGKHCTCFA